MASHGVPIYVRRDKLPIKYVEAGNDYEWVRASLISSTAKGSTIVLRGNTSKGSSNAIDITTDNDKEASILRANDESFELEEDLINLTHLVRSSLSNILIFVYFAYLRIFFIHSLKKHEPAVVEILENRYEKNFIYTGTGSILLALNPCKFFNRLNNFTCVDKMFLGLKRYAYLLFFQKFLVRQIPELYDEKAIMLYKNKNFSPNGNDALTLPPHVYRTAQTAYSNIIRMASNSQCWNDDGGEKNYLNQSILVSGESGAGTN